MEYNQGAETSCVCVHLFIVNCLHINKFNIQVVYYLYISVNTISQISCKEYNLIKIYNKLVDIQA